MSVSLLTLVTTINDALALANALTPLVQQAMEQGQTEVSDEDVAAARAKADKTIADGLKLLP